MNTIGAFGLHSFYPRHHFSYGKTGHGRGTADKAQKQDFCSPGLRLIVHCPKIW
jgi:hypothetical protein